MSYLVIARKWRPQTFEEVVGQPHVTRTLQNAIRLDRIAHAYLFTGARGVGKTSIARILAKVLNCEKGPAPSPCGQCSNCREIAQGNSVDVLEIDGASNRGIDNIRELRETVRYRPAKGRYKVYIIDEVHMLTTEAFNALLKTLEEPPAHVVFIFATTEPHKIPATILSRCQRFDFRRLALSGLIEHLKRITAEEGAQFSDLVLYAIAREADGSMRDAQSLLEQLLAFSGDGLPDEEILDILGVIDRRSVLHTGEAVVSGDTERCLDLVDDLYRRGVDSRRFCQHLCDHFRNLLVLAMGEAHETRLDLPDEEKKLLRKQVSGTTPHSLHLYFQMLLRGEEEIRRSSMPKIALEMLLLRMAQLPRLESLDAVLERIGSLENSLRRECPGGQGVPANRKGASGDFPAAIPSAPPPGSPEREKKYRAATGGGPASPQTEFAEPVKPFGDAPPPTPGKGGTFASDDGFFPPEAAYLPPEAGSLPEPTDFAPPVRNVPAKVSPPRAQRGEGAAGAGEQNSHTLAGGVAGAGEPVSPSLEEGIAGVGGRIFPSPAGGVEGGGDPVARWSEFVRFLEEHDPMLWAKVSHCAVRASGESLFELEVPDIFEKSANGPQFLEKLGNASQAFFGCRFEWVTMKKPQGAKAGPAPVQNPKSPKPSGRQVMNHPAIQQAIEILGAELVEVKPLRSSGTSGARGARKTGQGR